MNKMEHDCGKDIFDKAVIFYRHKERAWWMSLGYDRVVITHCPFCGEELPLRHPELLTHWDELEGRTVKRVIYEPFKGFKFVFTDGTYAVIQSHPPSPGGPYSPIFLGYEPPEVDYNG